MDTEIQTEGIVSRNLTLRQCFDQVLERHMGRLIGARCGIGGLPFNLVNMACIILLTEQMTEEMDTSSSAAERHTTSTLLGELSEMGITLDDDPESLLQDLISMEYVEVDREGMVCAKKPAVDTARILEQVFPNMPAMSLLAALAQTMDEVRGGSKDLESSLRRFDQILKIQGLPLKTERTLAAGDPKDSPFSSRQKVERAAGPTPHALTQMRTAPVRRAKLSDIYTIPLDQRATSPTSSAPETVEEPRGEAFQRPQEPEDSTGISLIPSEEPLLPAATTGPSREVTIQGHDEYEEPELPVEATPDIHSAAGRPTESATDPDSPLESVRDGLPLQDLPEETAHPTAFDGLGCEKVRDGAEQPSSGGQNEQPPAEPDIPPEDDEIEKRIAEFEGKLALQCPICKSGLIREEKTSAGKVYYKCAGDDCNFISWGRPFHLPCPRCENPFLIEVTARDGSLFLKCPRATCAHRQAHPWSVDESPKEGTPSVSPNKDQPENGPIRVKKRLVKRRVVRRRG